MRALSVEAPSVERLAAVSGEMAAGHTLRSAAASGGAMPNLRSSSATSAAAAVELPVVVDEHLLSVNKLTLP